MGTSDGWMLLRGAQPPWNEECVLVFDEHYTEANTAELHPSGTAYAYMYKDLEKVWTSAADASCSCGHSIYITCSRECMWNGTDNLLVIKPYKDEHVDDCLDATLLEVHT